MRGSPPPSATCRLLPSINSSTSHSVSSVLDEVVDTADVRMIELGEDTGLAEEPRFRDGVEAVFGADGLHRDAALQRLVESRIHLAHAALTKRMQHAVMRDCSIQGHCPGSVAKGARLSSLAAARQHRILADRQPRRVGLPVHRHRDAVFTRRRRAPPADPNPPRPRPPPPPPPPPPPWRPAACAAACCCAKLPTPLRRRVERHRPLDSVDARARRHRQRPLVLAGDVRRFRSSPGRSPRTPR